MERLKGKTVTTMKPDNDGVMHRLYYWVLEWLQTPYGVWVLFLVAVAESSFFPIPPDVFLMALCIGSPNRSFRYGAVCAVGSVFGGILGYGLGFWFMDALGSRIIEIYGLADKYQLVQDPYRQYDAWAVGAAVPIAVSAQASKRARFRKAE